MSFSHVNPSPNEDKLLNPGQIRLIKLVLKDQPTSLFTSVALNDLIENYYKNHSNPDISSETIKDAEIAEEKVNIAYRILKLRGEKGNQDKYFIIDKGVKKGKALGAGFEGTVKRLIEIDSNEQYALKVIKLSDDYEERTDEENSQYQFTIMQKINEAYGVLLKKTLPQHEVKSRIPKHYIIMKLAKGKNLHALLRDHVDGKNIISVNEWMTICFSILKAVDELHKKGVFHRDLKLENIMYDRESKKITLVDFGCACEHKNKLAIKDSRSLGTSGYQSPEIKFGEEGQYPSYSIKSEVYALGQLFKEILGFEDFEEPVELGEKVIQNRITNPELVQLSSPSTNSIVLIENFLNTMKEDEIEKRFTMEEAIHGLKKIYIIMNNGIDDPIDIDSPPPSNQQVHPASSNDFQTKPSLFFRNKEQHEVKAALTPTPNSSSTKGKKRKEQGEESLLINNQDPNQNLEDPTSEKKQKTHK